MYNTRPDVFADAAKLPFANASMDTVVLFQTLEHVSNPSGAVDEIYRVLRPNGCVLLTVPFIYPLHDEPYDYTRFTCHGLRRALEAAGFSVEEIVQTLDSAKTAGLLVCLTLGGMVIQSFRRRSASMILAPICLMAIPMVNLASLLASKLLPNWSAVPAGYRVLARKIT